MTDSTTPTSSTTPATPAGGPTSPPTDHAAAPPAPPDVPADAQSPAGGPTSTPADGNTTDPGDGDTTTGTDPTGSTDGGTPTDAHGAQVELLGALIGAITAANTPELAAARAVLVHRLAYQGDVIPSRIPAPANISEVGGYLNLLASLQLPALEVSALSSALGIAPPY